MPRAIDLSGHKFGRLTAIEFAGHNGRYRKWKCRCDCGETLDVLTASLRNGNTRSCGCLKRDTHSLVFRKHGRAGTNVYWLWADMIARCTSPRHQRFSDYGGRGITVCDAWKDSIETFLRDMGPRPIGSSLDRIDNSDGYHPGNCRWASRVQQANNKRNNKIVLIGGEMKTLAEWSRESGVPYHTLKARVASGLPEHELLSLGRLKSGPKNY